MAEMSWDGVLRRRIFITAVWTSVMTHGAVLIFCEGCHQNLLLLIKCCSRRTMYLEIKKKNQTQWLPDKNITVKILLSNTSWVGVGLWGTVCDTRRGAHASEWQWVEWGNEASGPLDAVLHLLWPKVATLGFTKPLPSQTSRSPCSARVKPDGSCPSGPCLCFTITFPSAVSTSPVFSRTVVSSDLT
jgi:hypothetical protein